MGPRDPEKCRMAGKIAHRKVCEHHDVSTLCQLRNEQWRIRASSMGFFGAETMPEIEVLTVLRDKGPMTAMDVARARGKYVRRSCRTTRILAMLRKRGMVKVEREKGKGWHGRYLWSFVGELNLDRRPAENKRRVM